MNNIHAAFTGALLAAYIVLIIMHMRQTLLHSDRMTVERGHAVRDTVPTIAHTVRPIADRVQMREDAGLAALILIHVALDIILFETNRCHD